MHKKRNKATLGMHAQAEKSRFFLLYRHQKPQAAHIQRQNTTKSFYNCSSSPSPPASRPGLLKRNQGVKTRLFFLLGGVSLRLFVGRRPPRSSHLHRASSADAKSESKHFFSHCLILSFFLCCSHTRRRRRRWRRGMRKPRTGRKEESSKPSPQIFPNPFSSQSENPVASGMPDRSIHGTVAFFVMMDK